MLHLRVTRPPGLKPCGLHLHASLLILSNSFSMRHIRTGDKAFNQCPSDVSERPTRKGASRLNSQTGRSPSCRSVQVEQSTKRRYTFATNRLTSVRGLPSRSPVRNTHSITEQAKGRKRSARCPMWPQGEPSRASIRCSSPGSSRRVSTTEEPYEAGQSTEGSEEF